MMDDTELLRRYVADRSQAAFTELVTRHLDLVYSAAFRRTDGDAALAEDIAQQVFTTLARNAAALRGHTLLPGWLYVATRHAAASALRAERRRKTREQEAQAMNHLTSSPEMDWRQLRPELDAVIDQLDDRDRDAVLLRFFEGRPFAEIGASLRISEDGARMRVDRALEKLRALLAKRGVTSTAAALALALANQAVVAAPAGLAAAVTSTALTGTAAAGGGVWAVLQLFAMSKLSVGIAGVAMVAAGTGVALQQQANAQVQREIDALRQENHQIRTLQDENLHMKQTAAEVATLRADDAELAQLSTKATALRVRLQAQARVQATNRAQAPAGPYTGPVYDVTQLDQAPVARFQAWPTNSTEQRQAGVTAEVTVSFVVDPEGNVRDASAIKSTNADFDTVAVESIKKWNFKPGQKGGQPVGTRMQVPIFFTSRTPNAPTPLSTWF
jgi:RNA polymerase sigma factor (sigma-70 family)